MLFNPVGDSEKAGILLFKDETHQYFFCMKNVRGQRSVALIQIGEKDDKELTVMPVDNEMKAICLKVVSRGSTFDFYYSSDTDDWKLLCKDVDAGYLSTNMAGGFTGTTIGMYGIK